MTSIDRYLVVGHPVAHSQSPFIHAEFARQTGQALDYGRALWPVDGFAAALRALVAGGARGCNVTVPFKFEAARCADVLSPRAALAEAVNTLSFDGPGQPVRGDNTDGVGLVRDIERNAGVALAGRRVLLIGAGGAAAGVLGPLLAAAPACVVVANRTPARAEALVARHAASASATRARRLRRRGSSRRRRASSRRRSTAAAPASTSSSTRLRQACSAPRCRSRPRCWRPARWRST